MVNGSTGNGLAIDVRGLTKKYGQLVAVDGISFEVNKGEFFGFLGPNGAGKTTTIRMLTGIISKSGGEARVMGYPAGSIDSKQISGVVPEQSNVYMDLTAWRNLMLTAELYRIPSSEAKMRAENLLKQLGLYERKDSPAKEYSMGMRKRLLLAVALISDPQIVFLDEPTSGLDVQSARFIRGLLRDFRQGGKTFFLTTHNMSEAAEMCNRVAIINRGKLVALDTPENLRITAGKVSLIDISFDMSVSDEALKAIPGVIRVESSQAIDTAERMKATAAMGGMGPGKMGPGMRGPGMAGRQGMGMPQAEPTEAGEKKPPSNRFRLHTEDTGEVITSLVDFSRANSLKMNILNVNPPSLEDAFVMLTGEAKREK
ncbi:MAG: ABC transporter ATP-binding protein [Chloroflexi bacterium]|nr:ABC transporter ATP-binding protein [Chloroflexota bacterium]MBL7062376.1 ABC transporter ATP-binding protein [Dehalococcoidia bacterium]